MIKMRKSLAMVLVIMLIVSACSLLFIACDNAVVYTIKVDDYDANMGTVTLAPDKEEYNPDEEVTLTVTPKTGYVIKSVYIDDSNVTTKVRKGKGVCKFSASSDATIKVEFCDESEIDWDWIIDINVVKDDYGAVTVEPAKEGYFDGEDITITVEPNKFRAMKLFSINNTDLTTEVVKENGKYLYTMEVTADIDLLVEFGEDLTKIRNATVDTFDDEINFEGKVVVDFWAMWCTWCLKYTTVQLNEIAREGKIKIVKVEVSDIDHVAYPEQAIYDKYAKQYGSTKLPFIMLFENGQVSKVNDGAFLTTEDFKEWLGI